MYVVDLTLCTDAELILVYNRTTGETGDPTVEALLAEIKHRGLDV